MNIFPETLVEHTNFNICIYIYAFAYRYLSNVHFLVFLEMPVEYAVFSLVDAAPDDAQENLRDTGEPSIRKL